MIVPKGNDIRLCVEVRCVIKAVMRVIPLPLMTFFNPLIANPTKRQTLKQFVGNLLTNCLSVLDHFVGLASKRLISVQGSTN